MKTKSSLLPTSRRNSYSRAVQKRFGVPSALVRLRCQCQQRPVFWSFMSLLICAFTTWLLVISVPTYVGEVRAVVKDLNELAYGNIIRPTYYHVIEAFDTCESMGMVEVEALGEGEEVVQGEGQSWNHVGHSSGKACAYRMSREEQLPELTSEQSGYWERAKGLPKIYVYRPEVNAYAKKENRCEEQFFTSAILSNTTGTLVPRAEDADRIYVAFLAQCFPNQEMDLEGVVQDHKRKRDHFTKGIRVHKLRKMTPFELLWEEVKGRDEIKDRLEDVFIFSERHWTKRTGFGEPIRNILKDYPFTILSPEVTNLKASEALSEENQDWLARHVVMPQPPLVAWPLDGATRPQGRPYKFCFSGTQINNERRVLSDVLNRRNDSMVVAGCRRDRENLQHHLRNNKFSATQQYRRCEMCLVPHGDSLSDRRLFDAMASGCVPVVTPLMRPLPFAMTNEVDYGSAALFLRENMREEELESELNDLAQRFATFPEELQMLRENSVRIARKLSYSECGDQAGLVLTLNQLRVQRDLQNQGTTPYDLVSLLMEREEEG